jgi:hypothetical protein
MLGGISPISRGSAERSIRFSLPPREIHVIQLGEGGKLLDTASPHEEISSSVKKAIAKSPSWLEQELNKQFLDLAKRPIYTTDGGTPTVGDFNKDGNSDLVIGTSKGSLVFFTNQGDLQTISLHYEKTIDYPDWANKEINPSLFDLNQDKLADLLIGVDNMLYLMINQSAKDQISFSSPQLLYSQPFTEEKKNDNFTPCGFDLEGKNAIILGHKDGTLGLLTQIEGTWSEDIDFFRNWKEKWREEGEDPKGIFVSGNASPTVYKTPNQEYVLCIGSDDGTVFTFLLKPANGSFIIQTLPLLKNLHSAGKISPAFMDINNNSRMDIVFCSNTEPISYLLNDGTNSSINFQLLNSDGEKNPINDYFGGSGFYRDFNPVYASGYNNSIIESVANFLSSIEPKYQDEVAYCIANMQTEDLVSYVANNTLFLLLENAKNVYEMASKVKYLKIKELTEATTLSYNTDKGWKDMPSDVYYNYLVMLNRYLLVPNGFEKLYQKNFFRSYLPYDKTYEYTLFDRVKDANTLYDAAYQVMYWLKVDIGGVWHTGEKPKGWYNIYHNLLNKDVGIWCGEWSIIYEACARSMNIPTIIIVAMGEDHQFNNFWADSWHHVDPSAGESKVKDSWAPYFDDSLAYYKNWGKRIFSWPMEWEGNGKYDHVWRSELPYNPPEILSDVSFKVTDQLGTPIDGARIELWSHWPMEGKYQPVPFISAIGYTNTKGEATIVKVGHQRFTAVIVSRIGTVQFFMSFAKPGNFFYPVTIPGKIPALYPFETIKKTNIDPEKAVKRWSIVPGNPNKGEAFIDSSTQQTFILARDFADFIDADIKWDGKNHKLTLSKKELVVTFQEKSKIITVNGAQKTYTKNPLIIKNNFSFLDINPLVELYGLKTEQYQSQISLIYEMVQNRSYQVSIDNFAQDNYPMIDVYTTILHYRDLWKQKIGYAEVYLLSEKELKNMQAGIPMERGDIKKLTGQHDLTFQIPSYNPTNETYFLVFWNPNFATQVDLQIKEK